MPSKKKKPAANPARGFATTSIASKPKPEKTLDPGAGATTDTQVGDEGKGTPEANIPNTTAQTQVSIDREKELHELSPEELTRQLEHNELQMLIDNFGSKVQREISKLGSKLRTDGRVLRSQAQHVSLRKWLPDELLEYVLEIISKEKSESGRLVTSSAKELSEDDITIRCWTLWDALDDFGIDHDEIKKAIREIVRCQPRPDPGAYIWGFRESIEFLCLQLNEQDLPKYEPQKARPLTISEPSSGSQAPFDSEQGTPEASPGLKPRVVQSLVAVDVVEEDVSMSGIEDDEEPENLISTYLLIKERLFKYRPQLFDEPRAKGKKTKQPGPATQPRLKPNAAKLQSRLRTIESDVLFDRYDADQRWSIRYIQLVQEAANTRALEKMELEDARPCSSKPTLKSVTVESTDSDSAGNGASAAPSDDGSMLGDMFASAADDDGALAVASSDGITLELREMGRIAGLSPRRILEDACKARDSKVSIKFKLVSPTTYMSRYAMQILWSVDQDRVTAMTVPYIQLHQAPSSKGENYTSGVTFTMVGVANPDQKQSEAFIATVGLFYLATTSQKEEKQYQKLPGKYRDLYQELTNYQKDQADSTSREKLRAIQDMIRTHSQQEEDDGVLLASAFRGRSLDSPRPGSSRGVSPPRAAPKLAAADCTQIWQKLQSTPNFQRMLMGRMELPMFSFKTAALEAISKNQVTILCGETGCGKSTQLPSYLLEHELSHGRDCKIYCTQPRRISAISLAQRVSEELGEHPGQVGTSQSLVGYAVRLESKMTARTKLVYATVGVVLRMLEGSKSLDDITHLIIDEVHERSIDTDFLLIVMRSLMIKRPELKVILMSATVDSTRFSAYLNNAPIINVPGRTFPVQTKFLEDAIELTKFHNTSAKPIREEEDAEDAEMEGGKSGIQQLQGYTAATRNTLAQYDEYRIDYELIVRLMEQVAVDPTYTQFSKATLVFLPGIAEIRELNNMLTASPVFQNRCWVIPLHSSIASEEQQLAFQLPPVGVRKVVLATNIAETGITIPDVTCVIDTGKHKEMRFDERRQMSRLIQSFISRANAKQRRGRAGRVQEGLCFHLFTKYRHDELMASQQTPEMLRLSLQDLIMRVKICGLGKIEETLAMALDPPAARNVRRAIDSLIEVGALTSGEELTSLGSQLAKLPLDANLGKLCLLSAIFGCLDVGLTISAILSSKSPFITPFGDRQRADIARLSFAKGDSDLLTAYNAYKTWRLIWQSPNQSIHAWCRKCYVSHQNMCNIEDLKAQLLSSLAETGLCPLDRSLSQRNRNRQTFVTVPPDLDVNSAQETMVQAVIAWSFYPKLLVRDGRGFRNISNSQQVNLHPTSVNKGNNEVKFLSYYSMMASSAGAKYYNALSTTAVPDVPLMLLAGDADWKLHAGTVVVDGNRLRMKVDGWKVALVLRVMRQRLEELVNVRLRDPARPVSARGKRWLEIWGKMCASYAEKMKALKG